MASQTSGEDSTDSQCELVPVVSDLLDVVLQVVEEQLHHVQLLLRPPEARRAHLSEADEGGRYTQETGLTW